MPPSLTSTFPIICFSTTDWHETWGSRQQLMQRLARGSHPVLFVERQVSIEHLIRDPALRARKRNAWRSPRLRQQIDNLWLWQPPILPAGRYYSTFMNWVGQIGLARQVHKLQEMLSFSTPILWLYPPQSAPLLGKFNEGLSIYHCIENFSGNQIGIKRQVIQAEERHLLGSVDLVFTHSEGLLHRYEGLTRRKIKLVPSAADVSYIQSISTVDPAVYRIPYPRLGVMGTLDARLDVELLRNVVASQPGWHLVLIGQWRPERINLCRLLEYPNVHYLGHQPFEKLPSLLNGLDILLIPYILNEMTRFISPIKLYEYLAVGKPIISTNMPEVSAFKGLVRIAENAQEFINHIQQALTSDTQAEQIARRNLARQHSWDNRLEIILKTITETWNEKNDGSS